MLPTELLQLVFNECDVDIKLALRAVSTSFHLTQPKDFIPLQDQVKLLQVAIAWNRYSHIHQLLTLFGTGLVFRPDVLNYLLTETKFTTLEWLDSFIHFRIEHFCHPSIVGYLVFDHRRPVIDYILCKFMAKLITPTTFNDKQLINHPDIAIFRTEIFLKACYRDNVHLRNAFRENLDKKTLCLAVRSALCVQNNVRMATQIWEQGGITLVDIRTHIPHIISELLEKGKYIVAYHLFTTYFFSALDVQSFDANKAVDPEKASYWIQRFSAVEPIVPFFI